MLRLGKNGTVWLLATLLVACGGNDEARPGPTIDMLDPAEPHYGKTYAQWAGDWVQYIYDVSPPQCVNPINDATGADCGMYQDPDSPVFMLVGNYGGVSIRDECVVPAEKAIFLPLLNVSGDNAGIPDDMILSNAELEAYVVSSFDVVLTESLRLEVDGHSISNLERGAIRSAPYTVDLEPEANIYECLMIDGVEGEFSGYLAGYWAMLAPLDPGPHTIEFGGKTSGGPQGQAVTIAVRYELTVE